MMCKYCNVETDLAGFGHANHVAWCKSNPNRAERAAALVKARQSLKSSQRSNQHIKAAKEGKKSDVSEETRKKISETSKGRLHTLETKEKLSALRKQWLQTNPELHPWKKNDKFKSVPCEVLKERLRAAGHTFEEEYTPLLDRSFSVDIAFPSLKFAVEVNGEQHYNRDGSLRSYYRERHELIVKSGWRILELHYSRCYSDDIVDLIVSEFARVA